MVELKYNDLVNPNALAKSVQLLEKDLSGGLSVANTNLHLPFDLPIGIKGPFIPSNKLINNGYSPRVTPGVGIDYNLSDNIKTFAGATTNLSNGGADINTNVFVGANYTPLETTFDSFGNNRVKAAVNLTAGSSYTNSQNSPHTVNPLARISASLKDERSGAIFEAGFTPTNIPNNHSHANSPSVFASVSMRF
jgi:hypothetical protein